MRVTGAAAIVCIFCHLSIIVDSQQTPVIDAKTENRTVKIGETVVLDCAALNAESSNGSEVYWTKLNSERDTKSYATISINDIIRSENGRITLSYSLDSHKSTLRIQDVVESDAGIYKCSILREGHSSGSKSSKVRLSVHNPPSSTRPPSSNPTPPVIYNVSSDLIVNENEAFSLECYASGIPSPLISWSHNERVIYRGNVLQIHATRKENRGAYDCVAESFFGSDKRSVIIAVEFTPIVYALAPRVYQEEHSGADLKCKVEGFPLPDIEWSKNGVKISSDSRYTIIEVPIVDIYVVVSSTLRVKAIESKEFGTYVCKAVNRRGEAKTEIVLSHVTDAGSPPPTSTQPPKPAHRSSPALPPSSTPSSNLSPFSNQTSPVIYSVSSDLLVNENETFSLECHASGTPSPLISWKRNERVIYRGNVLQIHAIRKENRGAYDCVAESFFGSDKRSVIIAVEFTPIVYALAPRVYQEEHSGADLKCKVEGFPLPDIEWSKNGVKISSDSRYTIIEVPIVDIYVVVSSTLRVKAIESKDFGTYVCKAVNRRGEAKTEIVLSRVTDAGSPPPTSTQPPKPAHRSSPALPPSSTPSSNLSPFSNPTPPVIYNVSSDLIVNENETFSLECHASGTPSPLISWKRNERVIHRGNVLQIHAIRKENRGAYDCVADNYFGSDIRSVVIAVEFAPIVNALAPRVYQVEHSGADLKCRVEGLPLPDIEWSKNGVKISSDSRYTIIEVPIVDIYVVVSSTLRVKAIESKEFGTYVCKAVNRRGEAKTEIVLSHVTDAGSPPPTSTQPPTPAHRSSPALPPSSTPPPSSTSTLNLASLPSLVPSNIYRVSSDVVVKENETATLEWYATGTPQPLISWKRNEKIISHGSVLKIHVVRKENRGTYDCVAENYFGLDRKSVTVAVEFRPIVHANVPRVFQVEYNGVDLKCRVEGFPLPDIEWSKDGVKISSDSRYTVSDVPFVDRYVSSTLRVRAIEPSDFGMYVCKAVNNWGEARTEIVLSSVRDAGCPPYCD